MVRKTAKHKETLLRSPDRHSQVAHMETQQELNLVVVVCCYFSLESLAVESSRLVPAHQGRFCRQRIHRRFHDLAFDSRDRFLLRRHQFQDLQRFKLCQELQSMTQLDISPSAGGFCRGKAPSGSNGVASRRADSVSRLVRFLCRLNDKIPKIND
jgi:hypothetical protein